MMGQGGAAGNDESSPAELRAATVRGLQQQFPGIRVWYGEATGSWWAMVPLTGGPRLLEATGPQELRDQINRTRAGG